MSTFLSALLRRLRRRPRAASACTETRLQLISGHYDRDRVAAGLIRAHRQALPHRAPSSSPEKHTASGSATAP
jgi:hypothetical protein